MNGISIKSYAKINLSLDVLGINDDGYHEVSMVMQQIELHDDVLVRFITEKERKQKGSSESEGIVSNDIRVEISSNRPYLPKDERNIAYKAVMLMAERYGDMEGIRGGKVRIDIKKRIPVAAGLAGGSGNAAAVILALNSLWGLRLPVAEMMDLGARLGADVPFCVMGQAAANNNLEEYIKKDEYASCAALATGTGTTLAPIKGLGAHIVLVKPAFSVSTKDVYQGVDAEIERYENASPEEHLVLARPDNDEMIEAFRYGDVETVIDNMYNLLELYTLKAHPQVAEIKQKLRKETAADAVLMSGSGPTVYAVYFDKQAAKAAYRKVRNLTKETYLTRTLY